MTYPEDLQGIQARLRAGEFTMVALVQFYLDNIKASKDLNAYVEVFEAEALLRAKELDVTIKQDSDKLGLLFGAVVSIKDLICYRGHAVTASSKILSGFESQIDATAVEAIIAEGAIIIGRTNCDEFGMGSANQNSHYGSVLNGDDAAYIAGGSSGGSAVSVQMNTCLVALGTDTGGSVRQPASFCGLYGFKPSYGMVSRYGLVAYASSFDQLGLIGRHMADIHAFMKVVSVHDKYDATMMDSGLYADLQDASSSPKKIAILKPTIEKNGLSPEIKNAFEEKINDYQRSGHSIDYVDFEYLDYLVACYYILTTAEASSNLSRYDGVRYGYRSQDVSNLADMYINSRSEGFGSEVKKRIMLGSFVLSEAYYDAYYTKAQQVRQLVRNAIEKILVDYDFIMLPTTATPAWKHSTKIEPIEMYMSDIYTVLANLCGMPSLSIPLGRTDEGLSYGYQLLAGVRNDRVLCTWE
jgi:aspartyl-tRNA(Asn)/glutamyl-tRNA(Gln) amidotransferase subunit A